ncbi:MAG: N-acetyltransferase family protein [Actinomycetota bacterium]|nr:N-acetyltransferase family protein [Actinomycetota bacterium]
MRDEHSEQVLSIYQGGIDEGNATFETAAPSWPAFRAARLAAFSFVALGGDSVAGWVAASPFSSRACYSGVIEHSVYVHPDARGQGLGHTLLQRLIEAADSNDVWTIQSSIFAENAASYALHASAGFRTVGTRQSIARHHGRWRDTVLIERRSAMIR